MLLLHVLVVTHLLGVAVSLGCYRGQLVVEAVVLLSLYQQLVLERLFAVLLLLSAGRHMHIFLLQRTQLLLKRTHIGRRGGGLFQCVRFGHPAHSFVK